MDQSDNEKKQFKNELINKYCSPPQAIYKIYQTIFEEAIDKYQNPPVDTMMVELQVIKNQPDELQYIQIKIDKEKSNSFLIGKKTLFPYKNETFQFAHYDIGCAEDIILQYKIKGPTKDLQNYKFSEIIKNNLELPQYVVKDYSKNYEIYASVDPKYKCLIQGDKFHTDNREWVYEVKEIWSNSQDINNNGDKSILKEFCKTSQNENPCILLNLSKINTQSQWIVQYQTNKLLQCYQKTEGYWIQSNFETFFTPDFKYRNGMWILEGPNVLYKLQKRVFYPIENEQELVITKESKLDKKVLIRVKFAYIELQ